jgi:hypothetical protein
MATDAPKPDNANAAQHTTARDTVRHAALARGFGQRHAG